MIMEFRWAREKEQKAAFRDDCINSFHLNHEEQELLAPSNTPEQDITEQLAAFQENDRRMWGTEAQRAILSSAKWSEAMAATRGVPSFTGNSGPSVWPPAGTKSKAAPSSCSPASLESRRVHAAADAAAADARLGHRCAAG